MRSLSSRVYMYVFISGHDVQPGPASSKVTHGSGADVDDTSGLDLHGLLHKLRSGSCRVAHSTGLCFLEFLRFRRYYEQINNNINK